MESDRLPWHNTVKRVHEGSTVEQAIIFADLGQFFVRETESRRRELFCERKGSSVPAHFIGTVRSNTVPLQNSEAFALFQPLIDSRCLSIDSVCEWNGGEGVWIVFNVLKYEEFEHQDPVRPFLLFGHNPLNNYFKLQYLFVRSSTNAVLTEGTFHNPEPRIPHDQRKFCAGNEKVCEEIQNHLLRVMNAFRKMGQVPINPDEAGMYFLDIAHRLPKPGERFRRTHLSDDQTSRLYPACKEQLSKRKGRAGMQTTLWDAYNTVIEWVDREANALNDWERLRELWRSGIKDDALYEAHRRTKGTTNN